MKKATLFVLVLLTVLFMAAAPLWAFDSEKSADTGFTLDLNDDQYVMGPTVSVDNDVEGDLTAAGGQVNIDASVAQDLIAAGGMVDIKADVGDDIRVAGGQVSISGDIGDSLMAVGGEITISEDTTIDGVLVASGGTLTISGTVNDDALLSGGNITLSGKVNGNVRIDGVENLTVTDTAEITGDLVYTAAVANISDGAVVGGEISETIIEKEVEKGTKAGAASLISVFTATYIGGKIVLFLALFVLGIVLLPVIPKLFSKFNDRIKNTLGYCVGGGAIVLFGVPMASLILFILAILLFITIIGSGLGIVTIAVNAIILVLYGLLIYLSTVFISYLLGNVILEKTNLNLDKYGWKVLAYLIGLAIAVIAFSIPIIGWLIKLAAILFGLGGLSLVLKDMLVKACCKK